LNRLSVFNFYDLNTTFCNTIFLGVNLAENDENKDQYRKEELRGIFVLGLLAVLVTFRFAQTTESIMFSFGQASFDLVPILDITIAFWSLYAFFMVIGFSDYEVGKNLAEYFRSASKAFLIINFILLGFFALVIYNDAYPDRWYWLVGILVIAIVGRVIRRVRKIEGFNFRQILANLKKKPTIDLWEMFDQAFPIFIGFSTILTVSVTLIMIYSIVKAIRKE
jgi:hypothetical protein